MADLQNLAPQDSYQALLTLETVNISSSFKRIQDGAGVNTALGLSTGAVKSYGEMYIDTVPDASSEFTALLINSSNQVVSRELGAAAFDASGTPASRLLTIEGTEDQINVSTPNGQTLEADRTWTLSLPPLVNFPGAIDVSTNAEVSGSITNSGIADSTSATFAVLVDSTSTNVFVRRELDTLAFGGGVPETRTITFAGTANEITVDPTTAQDLSANRTVTISLPDDVTIGQDLTVTRYLNVGQVDEDLNELTGLLLDASGRVVRREFSSYAFSGGIPNTRTITMNGTANQVLVDTAVSGTPKALSSNLSFTVSLPDDVTLVDDLTVGGTVYILDVVGDVTVTKALMLMPSGEVVYRTLGDAAFVDVSSLVDSTATAQIIPGSANIDIDVSTAQLIEDSPVWNIDLADNVDIVGTLDVTQATTLDSTLQVDGSTTLNTVPSDTNELSVLLLNSSGIVVQNELDQAAFDPGVYDTGWVNIPAYDGSSIGWYNTTNQPDRPQYRVIGRTVLLKGELLIPLADASGSVISNYNNHFDASSTDVATTGTGYQNFGDKNISLPLFWSDTELKPDQSITFYNKHGLRVVTDGTSGSSYRIPLNSVVNFIVQPGSNRFVIQSLRDAETGTGSPFSSFWLRNDVRRLQCTVANAGDVVANFGTGLAAAGAGTVTGYEYKTSYDPTTTGPTDGLNMYKMTPYITGSTTTKYPVDIDATDGTFLGGFRIRLDDCYFTLSTAYTLKQIHDLL